MTDKELMQQALEALNRSDYLGWQLNIPIIKALRERLAQPNEFNPDWDAMAVMVEEQQRMAKRIAELERENFAWRTKLGVRGYELQIEDLKAQLQMQPCAGRNCGSTNPNLHSAECFEDYEKATGMAQRQTLTDERIESVRHMRDVQGYDGNWNYDPYMQGLYNGLEFALSLLEVRQPEFKDAPATWLGDIKFKRDKLSSGTAHDIKGKS